MFISETEFQASTLVSVICCLFSENIVFRLCTKLYLNKFTRSPVNNKTIIKSEQTTNMSNMKNGARTKSRRGAGAGRGTKQKASTGIIPRYISNLATGVFENTTSLTKHPTLILPGRHLCPLARKLIE